MNFFQLYDRATERYLANHCRPSSFTPGLLKNLDRNFQLIRDSFYDPAKISYQGYDLRIAYAMHYAPKHATIWHRGLRAMKSPICGCTRFNSIGPGPGSEVLAIVEAARPNAGTVVEVCCLEPEDLWWNQFDEAVEVYREMTGVEIVRTEADSFQGLWRGVPTVGSMVLSEVVRVGDVHAFLRDLRAAVSPSEGLFLDNTMYPSGNGVGYGLPELLGMGPWQYYIPKMNLDIAGACQTAMKNCAPRFRRDVTYEPKMLFIPRSFR